MFCQRSNRYFLAVQDSSIGDVVSESVSQLVTFWFQGYNDYTDYIYYNDNNDYNNYNDYN